MVGFRLWHETPIVVVGAARPPRALFSRGGDGANGGGSSAHSDLYYVRSSPKEWYSLVRAGAPTCDRFVTLAPHTPPQLTNEVGARWR